MLIAAATLSLAAGTAPAATFNCATMSKIPLKECQALVTFYTATGGDRWTNRAGWLQETDPCNEKWHGVDCDVNILTGEYHIDSLWIDNNGLTGTLPPELADLSELESFSIYYNLGVGGPIPEAVTKLTRLRHLDLARNQLTGPVPAKLADLSQLEYLNLSYNQLSGSIPAGLGGLSRLTYLDLGRNQLTGTIPSELGNLRGLTRLYLLSNQLTGSIPPSLGQLGSLQELWLYGNQLTGSIPPQLGNLTSLEGRYGLDLRRNRLSGTIPTELSRLTRITGLLLGTNQLTGTIPGWIAGAAGGQASGLAAMTALEVVDLGSNQLTGTIPAAFGSLTNLQTLTLQHNQLTGTIPPQLGNLTKLTSLTVMDNKLTGTIPSDLGRLTLLTQLLLSQNQLTGTIPPQLGNLAKLGSLDLRENRLSGPIPVELGNLAALTYLNLSSNLLTGSIPAALGRLGTLETLKITDTLLTGPVPAEIGSLAKLQRLHLHGNRLTGQLPAGFVGLGSLAHLSYHGTRLCAPPDAPFQTWLAGIADRQETGLVCGSYTYFLPSVAHLPGSGGTQWRTDVAAVNRGSAVTLQLTYHSTGSPVSRTASLPANGAEAWRDILVSLFRLSETASTSGTLAITSSGPIAITSRTYNQTATGTFGQYYPALTSADGMLEDSRGYLPQLRKGPGHRTNIGFLNLDEGPVTVLTRLVAAGGNEVGTRSTTLDPWRWKQENDIFASSGAGAQDTAYATVDIQPPGGRVWAYASLVDTVTGDPTTIPLLGGTPPRPFRVPSVAHQNGSGGTQWRTDLAAVNPGTVPANLTMTLAAGGTPVVRTAPLDPGATREWRDIAVTIFGMPAAAATSGTLEVASDQPVHLASRTYNQTPTGTFGQYYPACTLRDALVPGQVGVLPGLGKSERVRTNIGILNLGTAACTVTVRLFDRSGAPKGSTRRIAADPGRWKQENDIFTAANAGTVEVAYATVEVETAGGTAWAYASVVDAVTGDPTTIPVLLPY
jgi:Leucine-rich repeat (LRR) protein